MKKYIVAQILLLFAVATFAQQTPLLNHYAINPYLSNPAFAGSNGTNLYLLTRNQWVDVEGAPETMVATMDGMVGTSNIGYGLTISNDIVNIVGMTSVMGTYAYRLPLRDKSYLSFGLSIGFEQNRLLFDRIRATEPVEITLINNVKDEGNFDANAGLGLTLNNFTFGISSYQLLKNRNMFTDHVNNASYTYAFQRHFLVNAGYKLVLEEDKLSIDPYVQMRFAGDIAPQYDFNAMVNFGGNAWIGAGYRTEYGANFIAGGVLADRLLASYSYGRSVGPIERLSANSHELMVGYKFSGVNENKDTDKDGVSDKMDREPETPKGCEVDAFGVALDGDKDGVKNCKDFEANTPFGSPVDENGVALDTDADGVIDLYDKEPNTPAGCNVDKLGSALDTDMDGVADCIDKEARTPVGAKVDADGVALDTDNDKVPDFYDHQPETPHWQHMNANPTLTAEHCIVDKHGVAIDTDGDGISDCVDKELLSPRGALVDRFGVGIDTDKDGVPDGIDVEINSPRGSVVDQWGRNIPKGPEPDDDRDGVPNAIDLEPNTPRGVAVDEVGRTKVDVNPITANKLDIEEMDDNSEEWEYFMIVGVFKNKNNVAGYQKKLKDQYRENTKVLITSAEYYYVWTKQVYTKDEAYKEVKRLTSKEVEDYIVGNPWLWKEPKKK